MKVLLLGLDSATWNVFDDAMLSRYMPCLYALKQNGVSGTLLSTDPPMTATAWTSIMTGSTPPVHGVSGFSHYSFADNSFSLGNQTDCEVPTFFQDLSVQGLKVAGLNIPWTYPCFEVNGVMVAGYGAPGIMTYPASFREKLLAKIPDYTIMAEFDKQTDYTTDAQFEAIMQAVKRSYEQRYLTIQMLLEEMNFDVMMTVFQDLDKLGHFLWPYLSRTAVNENPTRKEQIFSMFSVLDEVLARMLELFDRDQTLVLILSDHGMGRKDGSVFPNQMLKEWGYLTQQSPFQRASKKIKKNIRSRALAQMHYSKWQKSNIPIEDRFPLVWGRTKAAVLRTEVYGYLYLNLKGRQPGGIVEPGRQADELLVELRRKFLNEKIPDSQTPLFRDVVTPAELYGENRTDAENFGDLILIPADGQDLKSAVRKRGTFHKAMPENSLAGIHRTEGLFVIAGPNIKPLSQQQGHMADIVPTVYAALGIKIPSYMDGRVMDVFREQILPEYRTDETAVARQKTDLSAEDGSVVYERLCELGYLD